MSDIAENVSIVTESGKMRVSICGDIDHHSARSMRQRIDTEFANCAPNELLLDMSGVGFMDSSGLGLILGRFSKASASGARFGVVNPSQSVLRVLDIAGAQRIISVISEKPKKSDK